MGCASGEAGGGGVGLKDLRFCSDRFRPKRLHFFLCNYGGLSKRLYPAAVLAPYRARDRSQAQGGLWTAAYRGSLDLHQHPTRSNLVGYLGGLVFRFPRGDRVFRTPLAPPLFMGDRTASSTTPARRFSPLDCELRRGIVCRRQKQTRDQKPDSDEIGNVHRIGPRCGQNSMFRHPNVTQSCD